MYQERMCVAALRAVLEGEKGEQACEGEFTSQWGSDWSDECTSRLNEDTMRRRFGECCSSAGHTASMLASTHKRAVVGWSICSFGCISR